MKKNIYGIIVTILCIINILFMIFCYFVYDMGPNSNIYIIGGTIISITLLILLFKNNVYGYIGTIIFYGIQMIGTVLIFDNFRYGLIFRQESDMTINSNSFLGDLNFTAILIVILSVFGYFRHIKLTEPKTESLTE